METPKFPLKLAICSWCYGIGGGASRMETAYYQYYNREIFEPQIVSLVQRPDSGPSYDSSIPFIQLDQKNRFFDLVDQLKDFDVIQFQGSFNPIVCEASRYIAKPHVLVEVLHNIEAGSLINSTDGTICVSSSVANIQKSGSEHRTILNGINISDFPLSGKKNCDDKIILLQVGRREKVAINLDEISEELLALDPRIELWIAGGDHHFESTDRVKFLGVKENIAEIYRNAHFMVLLSQEEPFGLAALESMASGTPVILSKSGGFLDIIKDSSQGFLVEGPSKEEAIKVIANAISILGTDPYEELVRTGRKLVEEKFSIEDCVLHYEKYILELYKAKANQKCSLPEPVCTPPNAIVGEALYDYQAGNYDYLVNRLIDLSLSPLPITEVHVLRTAHELAQFIAITKPEAVPKGLFPYLFFSSDRTTFTCNQILSDIGYLQQVGLYNDVVLYFEETKEEFPERLKILLTR